MSKKSSTFAGFFARTEPCTHMCIYKNNGTGNAPEHMETFINKQLIQTTKCLQFNN